MNEGLLKFEKYQREILGPSSSDSVATLGKKFGNIFFQVCMFFLFLKKPAKKWNFDQNRINFIKILVFFL